jgi:putative CocE/NonD family hydrolase
VKIVTDLPHAVRDVEHVPIPMPDGCRLAARLWLPEGADDAPVPAILEYIPYRKRDRTRWRDEPMHRWFAGHGYACVRVDLRGSGESEGLLLDEYLPLEQDDGEAVIAWIARQPWCDGNVGMLGKSWGGFNGLQLAARRPPALKAILTVCSTDDRYADDAHYMGGCLLNENLIWGSVLLTLNALPPDPELVGGTWAALWKERLQHARLFPATWLRHARRDDYWKQGSVCEDFAAIACPVYAVGGWADGYSNAVPRLLAGLSVPARGLVGPWAHVYPHHGVPGPPIGFLQEALRWWDRWLRGVENGIEDEPAYRVWMQESVAPDAPHDTRPGRWVAEACWPSARVRPRRWALEGERLVEQAAGATVATAASPAAAASAAAARAATEASETAAPPRTWCAPQSVGLAAGAWCGFGVEGEQPADQREDDARSLHFTSGPLALPLEILGAPVVTLRLAIDRPLGFVAVRLVDVRPDGGALRVSYGLLNLAHRDGHEQPAALTPGRAETVRVTLNDAAHAFPAGHRVRVSISTAYWPMVWPSPEPVTLTLHAAGSALELPERPPRAEDAALPAFEPPECAPPPAIDEPDDADLVRREVRRGDRSGDRTGDLTGETLTTVTVNATEDGDPHLSRIEPIDLTIGHAMRQRYSIRDDDPLSARAEIVHRATTQRGEWSTRVETRCVLTSTREAFRLQASLRAWAGEECVAERLWDEQVPRDHV